MSRGRFTGLLIAALVVLAAALYLGSRRNSGEPSAEGMRFLPQLAGTLGTVSQIDLQKGTPTAGVTLHRAGDQWTVAQRADYPADISKVHKLLLSLADAKIVEEKTSNPREFFDHRGRGSRQAGGGGYRKSRSRRKTARTRHRRQAHRRGQFRPPRGRGSAATPSSPASAPTPSPGRGSIRSLLDVPVAQIQSVEEKFAAGPGLHGAPR